MSFVAPMALLWGLLTIPIVVLYILKVRLRRVPVSTMLFWRQVFEEKPPRSIWERLRHLLSLLLQLAFLALLVLALAEPFFAWELRGARTIVFVVDNSASMGAADTPPSRLARAQDEARRRIAGIGPRDRMAVVAAGSVPEVICGLTGHERTLREAVDRIVPTEGPTAVPAAVDLARRVLAGRPNGSVVVLTDAAFDGAEALTRAGDVRLVRFGTPNAANLAITRFQVRRSLVDPIGYEILAEVDNLSNEPAEFRLELDLDGAPVDVVPLKLEPGGHVSKVFEKVSAKGGKLLATLKRSAPDALAVDDRAWGLLPTRRERPVVLVTEGNHYLQQVFRALPLVQLQVVKELPATLPSGAVVVLHRTVPPKLPNGPVFVIDPRAACDAWTVGEPLKDPIVTKLAADSPLMAHVKLNNILMPEARRIEFVASETARVVKLAESVGGEPLYAAYERPAGKVLVLTVDLDQGDLPLQTAFPILVTNALMYLTESEGEIRESISSGSVAEVDVPASAARSALRLRGPDGSTRPVPPTSVAPGSGRPFVTVGPLDRCGIWSLETATEVQGTKPLPLVEVACNLANKRESDLRVAGDPGIKPEATAGGFGSRPIWYYLLACAWMLAGWEWFLYQRRYIA